MLLYVRNFELKLTIFVSFMLSVVCADVATEPVGDCDFNGLYSDGEDCTAYYFCRNGLKYRLSCGSGKMFDPIEGECKNMINEKCKPGQTIYVPDKFTDLTSMKESQKNANSPKIICYMSNWNFCFKNKDQPIPDQVICNQACYTSATLTAKPDELNESCSGLKAAEIRRKKYKVICYFPNWDGYRRGPGKFEPENIEPSLCTHIIYAYAVLDTDSLKLKTLDTEADINQDYYNKILALKSKGVKVLIAVGGWFNSEGDKFSRMVSTYSSRQRFINSVLRFLKQWNFDGIEMDWDFPKCWRDNCDSGPVSDKEFFASLIEELGAAFKPKGLLLSSTMARRTPVIDQGFDLPVLTKHLDWINVMTYNYAGYWSKVTGIHTPIYNNGYDFNNTIYHLINGGFSRRKIIVGVALNGNTFQLANPELNDIGASVTGPGKTGEYSESGGALAFYEICNRTRNQDWKVVRDEDGINPYAYKGDQWVSYNDITDVIAKADFIKKLGLGGGFIWNLSFDDFTNVCGCGKFPLLNTLSNELRGVSIHSRKENCS